MPQTLPIPIGRIDDRAKNLAWESKILHKHLHRKRDGRALYLYSEHPRDYVITNDLEPTDSPPDPQRRWHPLRQEWVLYNPGRNRRTFHPPSGYNPLAPVPVDGFPGEIPTPDFEIAVFENRWPGLSLRALDSATDDHTAGQYPAIGHCDVVVYGTDLSDRLYDLSDSRVALLLQVWSDRYRALMATNQIDYVLPFESRGDFVGVTLPHPHGQIYGFGTVPPIILRQAEAERADGILKQMIAAGLSTEASATAKDVADDKGTRYAHPIQEPNPGAPTVIVPTFARYPFETWVLPPRHVADPASLTADERLAFAATLKATVRALDQLFGNKMPLCMWVSLPPKGFEADWPFHIQFWPMQRSQGKMKYLASVEQITQTFLVDVMPEEAAQALRKVFVAP